ncbi:MAG: hypothetical protein OEU51_00530 [Gammaproteobacteria bacterium]|nr:hypothetical protein [Gammaproteobacteria bacterium]
MNKKNKYIRPVALLLMTIPGFVSAGETASKRHSNAEFSVALTKTGSSTSYSSVQAVHSDCRRNGVVWSGGIARRGPDRISPRPVRSRWQSADKSRIYCGSGDPFSQHRVADKPWIR